MTFKLPQLSSIVKNPVMTLIVILAILLVIFLATSKESYMEVIDYRIDLPLRDIENKQYVKTIEHFKSYTGIDKPQGITNTDVMGKLFHNTELAGNWDNFNITRPILKSSPVPEYLPQNIISIENEFVDADGLDTIDMSLGDRSKRDKGKEMDSAINKYAL